MSGLHIILWILRASTILISVWSLSWLHILVCRKSAFLTLQCILAFIYFLKDFNIVKINILTPRPNGALKSLYFGCDCNIKTLIWEMLSPCFCSTSWNMVRSDLTWCHQCPPVISSWLDLLKGDLHSSRSIDSMAITAITGVMKLLQLVIVVTMGYIAKCFCSLSFLFT